MARREYSGGVLVVEDEPLIAMHVATMLTELGFIDIRFAHSLANGLALMSWTLALHPGREPWRAPRLSPGRGVAS
jgi:hypothetical protein